MSNKQLILLATISASVSLYLKNIFEIKNLKECSILLATHSNDILLDSEKIREYREKLNSDLALEHQDKTIFEQLKLFEKEYTKEELLIMRNNLHNLIVDYENGSFFLGGSYNVKKNKISLNPLRDYNSPEYKEILNHEMHHMATRLRIDDYTVCGFEQLKIRNGISHIGKGLNEGYTEYLSKDNLKKEKYQYKKNVDLIPLIELFYDNKLELRKNYFNADLPSVIKKFSEITDRNSAIELIRDIDKLFFYDSNKTWFDKSEELEIDVRIKLYNLYKKLSGYSTKEELFFDDNMLEKVYRKQKTKKDNF